MPPIDKSQRPFQSVQVAIMTVSDTRTEESDTSGRALSDAVTTDGHLVASKVIVPDNKYRIREVISQWIVDETIQVIISSGGTGVTGRDITPEAVAPLFDKCIDGFGELFRYVSIAEVGTATLQSRAIAGIANGTLIFCLPGSTGAVCTAWNEILRHQLDVRYSPCNLVELLPRLREI